MYFAVSIFSHHSHMDQCASAASSAGSQCQNLTGENSSGGGWVGTIQLLDDQRAASCLLFKWAIHQKLLTKPYKGHDEDGVDADDHKAQCSIINFFALICKKKISKFFLYHRKKYLYSEISDCHKNSFQRHTSI